MSSSPDAFKILVVCTANECRSVFAVDQMRAAGFDQGIVYLSAGTQASPGAPRCLESQFSLSEKEIHSSRSLDAEVISTSDLILVMDREHRARVAEIDPKARFRCFTLKEIARLSEMLNSAITRQELAASAGFTSLLPANWKSLSLIRRMEWWVAEANVARGYSVPQDDDIADAHGNHSDSHKAVFEEITFAAKKFGATTLGALNFDSSRGQGKREI